MTNEKNIPQTCVTICLACLVGGGEPKRIFVH